jgi:hypothetical protein
MVMALLTIFILLVFRFGKGLASTTITNLSLFCKNKKLYSTVEKNIFSYVEL